MENAPFHGNTVLLKYNLTVNHDHFKNTYWLKSYIRQWIKKHLLSAFDIYIFKLGLEIFDCYIKGIKAEIRHFSTVNKY